MVWHVDPELWIADKNNNLLEVIELKDIISARLNFNGANAVPFTFEVELLRPERIADYSYLAPFQTLADPETNTIVGGGPLIGGRGQMGLYLVRHAGESYRHGRSTVGKLRGYDLTYQMKTSNFGSVHNVSVGQVVTDRIKLLVEAAGIRHHRIVPSTRKTTEKFRFPQERNFLDAANALAASIGYEPLIPDRDGAITTEPSGLIKNRTPSVTYAKENDIAQALEPFEVDPDEEGVWNHVVVINGDPLRVPTGNPPTPVLKSVRENRSPLSRISTTNLGFRVSKYVNDSNLKTQADLDTMAERLLEEGTYRHESARLSTRKDPRRWAREIYRLNLGTRHDGLWWCEAWATGFLATDGGMTHTLRRIVDYG